MALAFLPIVQGLIQVIGPRLDSDTAASLQALCLAGDVARRPAQQVLAFWLVVMSAASLARPFTCVVGDAQKADATTRRQAHVEIRDHLVDGTVGHVQVTTKVGFRLDDSPAESP